MARPSAHKQPSSHQYGHGGRVKLLDKRGMLNSLSALRSSMTADWIRILSRSVDCLFLEFVRDEVIRTLKMEYRAKGEPPPLQRFGVPH